MEDNRGNITKEMFEDAKRSLYICSADYFKGMIQENLDLEMHPLTRKEIEGVLERRCDALRKRYKVISNDKFESHQSKWLAGAPI